MRVLMIGNPSQERCDMLRALGYCLVFDNCTGAGIRGNSFENVWIDEVINNTNLEQLLKYCRNDVDMTEELSKLVAQLEEKPVRESKPRKPRQSIPFWASDYRRK